MRFAWRIAASVGLVVHCAAATAERPVRIDVFTRVPDALPGAASLRERGIDVRIHDVGARARLERTLSAGLPATQAHATALVRARIAALSRERRVQLIDAHQAQFRAQRLGVERYPAIVIDGRWIHYDDRNLQRAVSAWRRRSR